MTNAKHSSASALWYTPSDYIEAAREVLGVIDLDPASDEEANKTVRARVWYGAKGELWWAWPTRSRVFLNPPGGIDPESRGSNAVRFWSALMLYKGAGHLVDAIFVAFSIEQLQTSQCKPQSGLMDFPICIPSKRIRFVSPTGKKNSPTHANAIVYVPGSVDRTDDFIRVFSRFGACKR